MLPLKTRLAGRLRRAWPVARHLFLPQFFPGWIALIDWAQRIQFGAAMLGQSGEAFFAFLAKWGWLMGLLWLGGVVVRASIIRAGEADRLRKVERLAPAILEVIRRFDAFSHACESEMSVAGARAAHLARLELMHAAGELLRDNRDAPPVCYAAAFSTLPGNLLRTSLLSSTLSLALSMSIPTSLPSSS